MEGVEQEREAGEEFAKHTTVNFVVSFRGVVRACTMFKYEDEEW